MKKMRAAIYTKFGPPEVLQIATRDRPEPKPDEILIRIYATTVEKEDPDFRKSRGFNGIFKPKKEILGMFFAGQIEKIGHNVQKFHEGERIFGTSGMKFGTTAEYITLAENSAILPIPKHISYQAAASVLNGFLTALPFLRDKSHIQTGQHVLINGASGSVGSVAVQLAKYFHTEVTAVCSTNKVEFVQSLGADHVIDYKTEDFTKLPRKFDIVFDTVGTSTFSKCKSILNIHGIFLTTVPNLVIIFQMLFRSLLKGKKVQFMATGLRSSSKKLADLQLLNEMFERHQMKATIDKVYPLEEIHEAHRYVARGHKRGSVIISIDD